MRQKSEVHCRLLLCGHVLARVMFGEYGFLSKQCTSVFKYVNKSILSTISNVKKLKFANLHEK